MHPQVQSVTPILAVSDIHATLEYYKTVLGATNCWDWESPPTHAGCLIGSANIQFTLNPELSRSMRGFSMFLPCSKVEELYAFHRSNGANIVYKLEPKPWGVKEYTVEDINGAHLRFAQSGFLNDRKEPLEGISVVRRRLTPDELFDLMVSVNWTKERDEDGLAKAVEEPLCTAIVEHQGKAIGCGSILGNETGNYLIFNVLVHPDFQSQGVGKKIMAELDHWLTENGIPGAMVKLFTGQDRHAFYAQFGFRGPETGLIGMAKNLPK